MNDENLDREIRAEHNDDTEVIPDEEAEDPRTALKRLREKLKACSAEKQEYLTGWQRTRADFTNAKREEENRRREIVSAAKAEFLLDLLSIVDSFDMALQGTGNENGTWKTGFERIRSQCLSVLKRNGVEAFDPLGERFNPSEHESVATAPAKSPEENDLVLEVLQRGYRTDERVIRPAKVKIGIYES